MVPNSMPDDSTISNSELLLRRISPKNFDNGRISDAAFDDPECSVNLGSESDPEDCLSVLSPDRVNFSSRFRTPKYLSKGWAVAGVEANLPRKHSQAIYREAATIIFKDREWTNEAHAIIFGVKTDEALFEMAEMATNNILLP